MNKITNNKIFKRIIITIIIFIILIITATIAIGNYFVNYAIARSGNGGDRKIKNENTVVEVSTEAENTIDKNKEEAEEKAQEWSKQVESKSVDIKANDGVTLRGNEYINNNETNNWIIVLHGYRSTPKSVLPIGQKFYENGYNVLVPSMRGCDESDGQYIGMGWLDKEDLKNWISLITEENPKANIILHGSSMGAATVIMTSGDELPSNVKAIIEDSGYTSVWDIFASEAKARFNLPAFPVLNMFEIVANFRAGYDIKQASALEQVKKSKTPILFIHGTEDDFVPEYMCEKLYDAATCEKDKLIIEGAGHCESKYKESEKYYNKVFEFANKYIKNI